MSCPHLPHLNDPDGWALRLAFLPQLEKARVAPNRCLCGCASIDLSIHGLPEPSGGVHVLADFVFGGDDYLCGIFVFERNGVLAGLEVYGLAGDAPKILPSSDCLRLPSE